MTDLNEQIFPGTSEMAGRMRAFDWSTTPLGPVESWPASLRTLLHVMLTTRHPMFLWWGPELIQFYNDGYRISLGNDRHPAAIGARGREFWHEIWSIIGPQVEGVMQRAESTWQEDALVPILRNGRMEDVYWTYSYSPVLDEAREVGGTLVIVQETTNRVLSERRMDLLRLFGERLASGWQSGASPWEVAAGVLSEPVADFAFSRLYSLEPNGRTLRLVSGTGNLPAELDQASITAQDSASADPWGLLQALESEDALLIPDVRARFGGLFYDRWPEPVELAVAVPISISPSRPYGVLLAGLSPRIRLDESCRNFLNLLSGRIATAIANTQAFDDIHAAAALKDQFLSLVSHELRTPIATVVGNAYLLLRRAELLEEEDRTQALEDIASEGMKLQRVIENLLLLTRMDAADGPDLQPLSLKDLIAAEIDAFSRRSPDRSIALTRGDAAPMVLGQETLLTMVIENLLGNADKYSPAGRPVEVTIETRDRGQTDVCVRDFGIGIKEVDAESVFAPFFRTSTAKEYATGMGLGLSVCKRIIEAHGGRIWVTSRPDGTDFCFSLPLSR